ncbi:Serpin H1 [Dissostichus eleginoides]|uniref:Serpin H1 n=1 Tax=Dissostichus eleginoides TaxID=100907 RepID=A0AAD9F6X8_DISEL|nr:Serpin H1 [Dissostichus eleginoides]
MQRHISHVASIGSSDTWSVSHRVVASHSSAQSHAHTLTPTHALIWPLERPVTVSGPLPWEDKLPVMTTTFCGIHIRAKTKEVLGKQLSALGLTEAWDQKVADFSMVSDKGKGKLHLGGVLHWASLELAPQAGKGGTNVDENVEKPKLFYSDHPFIFFVRDNTTGALLLMGALEQPEGEALHDEL